MKERFADWKGALEKRFRWRSFRFEWGRYCYKTNCCGDTTDCWWEWGDTMKMTIDEARRIFEEAIKSHPRLGPNTPLGVMEVNGKFHHYMNPDTDTLWIGFALGLQYSELRKAVLDYLQHPSTDGATVRQAKRARLKELAE